MIIKGYAKLKLESNKTQEHYLENPKKVVLVNNSKTAEIKVKFGTKEDEIILPPNKTIVREDFYNINTDMRLLSAEKAEVEVVLNGDIRTNTSGGSYDDTEVRGLISDNASKIKDNSAEIEKLKTSSGGASSSESKFENVVVTGNKINVAELSTTNMLQKRYVVGSQLSGTTYEILLPLITDDPNTFDPPIPPNAPLMLPDINNNNYIEIYFSCLANCALQFKTQMTEVSSSSIPLTGLKAGKYKLTAKYNLVDQTSWQIYLKEN